jgi:hypothetical protein
MVNKIGGEMNIQQNGVNCENGMQSDKYIAWEDDVTNRIGHDFEVTRSDAQAIVEGQSNILAQAWKDGLSADETAKKVAEGATPKPGRDTFNYQLLGRLQQDCEYYLGHGNRAKKHLWAGDEAEQIKKMKELYAGFAEKPAWITLEDIERYSAAMSSGEAK